MFDSSPGEIFMIKVRSEDEIQKTWVKGSIKAYLKGKQNLNWIIGTIRSSHINKELLENLLNSFRESYPDNLRFSQLEEIHIEK
jgi:hypothetical protein